MTFQRFEEIFKTKYPDATAVMHGKFGGTDRNNKVAIYFKPDGKVYEYSGAYEDILCKLGIKVMSQSRFNERVQELKRYKEMHGTENIFSGIFEVDTEKDKFFDFSEEIAECEKNIEYIKANYIIV